MPHNYYLVRSRRRSLALIVERDGGLTVRAPLYLSQKEIDRFIDSRSDWITRKQAQAASRVPVVHRYEEGETFPFLGVEYPLRLAADPKSPLVFQDGFQLDPARRAEGEKPFRKWYRREARRLIGARVKHFAMLYGFRPGKVRISSARTRWGSCSRKGALSFTWRLVMAPAEAVDYVVVHELCHLRELNHSKAFWALVREILPDYNRQRDWLKRHGERLQL